MADIFGIKKRTYGADRIVAASGVVLSIDDKINLVQSVDLQYQRNVQAVYEIGTENVYAGTTGASGQLSVNRAVGMGIPALSKFRPGSPCRGQAIYLRNGEATCGDKFGILSMPNSIIQSVGIQVAANNNIVTESASFWVGSVEAH